MAFALACKGLNRTLLSDVTGFQSLSSTIHALILSAVPDKQETKRNFTTRAMTVATRSPQSLLEANIFTAPAQKGLSTITYFLLAALH